MAIVNRIVTRAARPALLAARSPYVEVFLFVFWRQFWLENAELLDGPSIYRQHQQVPQIQDYFEPVS